MQMQHDDVNYHTGVAQQSCLQGPTPSPSLLIPRSSKEFRHQHNHSLSNQLRQCHLPSFPIFSGKVVDVDRLIRSHIRHADH